MNSGYIPEAIISRLQDVRSEAIASTLGPRLLRDLESSLEINIEKVNSIKEAFDILRECELGTSAVLFIHSRKDVMAHVAVMTNQSGDPVIIEGQSWGPAHPQEVLTNPEQAEGRYGKNVEIGLGIVSKK